MEKFNYSHKDNPLHWLSLILLALPTLLFSYMFIMSGRKGDYIYPLLIPIVMLSLIMVILLFKLFATSFHLTENYIAYRSPFTKVQIDRNQVKHIEIVKRPRGSAPIYLPVHKRSDMHFGNCFFIIRKSSYRTESPAFLLFRPVDDHYITVEYSTALLEKLAAYKYI